MTDRGSVGATVPDKGSEHELTKKREPAWQIPFING